MTPAREQLTAGWAKLAGGTRGAREWRAMRLEIPHVLTIFAAVHENNGTRAVLFECPIDAAPLWRVRFESEGLALVDERDVREHVMRVALVLERPDLESIVLVIAEDLIKASVTAEAPLDAVTAIAERLLAWQTCLKVRREGLSYQRMLGLFGELVVMERIAALSGLDHVVFNWTGPDRGIHDFERAGRAIEVKTSSGLAGLVHVTALNQLDSGGLSALTLCRVAVVRDDDGEDLGDIIARVRAAADGFGHGVRQSLERGLLLSGYIDADVAAERFQKLGVVAVEGYDVREGFPRLTSQTVSPGIVAAEYRLDLASAVNYRMSAADLEDVFSRFATGGMSGLG